MGRGRSRTPGLTCPQRGRIQRSHGATDQKVVEQQHATRPAMDLHGSRRRPVFPPGYLDPAFGSSPSLQRDHPDLEAFAPRQHRRPVGRTPGAMALHERYRLDRAKYVESGKVLENETLETLTAYFQAIHDQRVLDGTLKQQLKQPAKASDERRDRHKDRGSDNRRPTSRRPDYQRDRHHDRDRDRGRGRDRHRDHRNCRDYDSHRSRDKVKDRSRSSSTKPKPIADPCPKHSSDGNPARHTWAECSLNPANSKASSSSRDRRGHDSHHSETRSPSPSRSRSPSPYSDDDRGRSSSPSDRSYASGTSNEDNYANFESEEVMKPPARERSGRKLNKANKAEPPGKRKRNRMKSVEDRIPKKWTATLESESSEEDGEANMADVRDATNPLDM